MNNENMNNKKWILILSPILLIILLIIIFANSNKSPSLQIPAIINSDNVEFKIKGSNENFSLSKGSKITIIEKNNDAFFIEADNKQGYVEKDKLTYFKFNSEEEYSLVLDVSKFNIINKNLKDFVEFAKFIVDNKINYTYIRLCGRGWGEKGTMYDDEYAFDYAEMCEYLKIPYGFYYIEEAKNNDEVLEEVNYVKKLLNGKNLSMNVLPLALDLEYQHGKGRTDDMWDSRVTLVNALVDEFNKNNIPTILYANGARIETYLKSANCKFWSAMYPENDEVPSKDYKSFIVEEEAKIRTLQESINDSVLNSDLNKSETQTVTYSDEYLDKVIGWQFTESGAKKSGIDKYIDLSIFNNKFLMSLFQQ
ncbi:MAG: hypothetical protein IKF83_02930 [Clostridia bacterium]|nr:hypothetical protein [Clostridia bacterium]